MAKTLHILNPRIDANFKAIFTQNTEESRTALKSFLSAAIGRKVTGVVVAENEETKDFDSQRGARYDINCTFDDGTLAQIEMQSYNQKQLYGKRAEYYVSRLVSSALDEGEDWDKLPKAYQISVLNCKFDKEHDNFFHHYAMTDISDGARLSDTLNVILLELPKLPKIDSSTDIESLPNITKWCKFLKEADNPKKQDLINALAASEEGIMSAENTLNKISMDKWRWVIQGRIEGAERDRRTMLEIAKNEGIEAGRSESARQSAKNLLFKSNLSAEVIADCCSLPLDQVLALQQEITSKKQQ